MEAQALMASQCQAEGAARTVALGLAYYANPETNLAYPSDELLMQWARVSKRTVQYSLRVLEQAGHIVRQPRQDGMPRRVYLVNPFGGHQLALDFDEGAPRCTFPAADEGAICDSEGATHARAGSNRRNQLLTPPPTPRLKRGGVDRHLIF